MWTICCSHNTNKQTQSSKPCTHSLQQGKWQNSVVYIAAGIQCHLEYNYVLRTLLPTNGTLLPCHYHGNMHHVIIVVAVTMPTHVVFPAYCSMSLSWLHVTCHHHGDVQHGITMASHNMSLSLLHVACCNHATLQHVIKMVACSMSLPWLHLSWCQHACL